MALHHFVMGFGIFPIIELFRIEEKTLNEYMVGDIDYTVIARARGNDGNYIDSCHEF